MISQLLINGHTGYLSYSATNLKQSHNAQVRCVVSGVLTTFTTNARYAGVMTLYQSMHCACAPYWQAGIAPPAPPQRGSDNTGGAARFLARRTEEDNVSVCTVHCGTASTRSSCSHSGRTSRRLAWSSLQSNSTAGHSGPSSKLRNNH